MESPCVNICTIDETQSFCIGCGRTLAEITLWPSMTREERQRIMQRLAHWPVPEKTET